MSAAGSGFCRQACRDAKRQPRRAGRPDHKIVRIDGDQRRRTLVGHRSEQNARVGKGQTEILRLDPAGSVGHRHRDEIDETFGQVGPAGGDIERRREIPLMIVDRRGRAAQIAYCA